MIVAVIPVRNEARFIKNVVETTKKYVDLVVVTDDNSNDDTVALARKAGASVITNSLIDKGCGGNTNFGMQYALYKYADIIVTLDGDGQHNPDEILLLLEPILKDKANFVIGSRFVKWYTIPLYRRLGISVITFAFNIFRKQKTSDAQSCFRAYTKKLFDKIEITDKGFGFSIETLVKIRANHFKMVDVPINCIYHGKIELNSSMNPIKHGLLVLFKVLYWRLRVEVCRK